jgi:hypothetical protein
VSAAPFFYMTHRPSFHRLRRAGGKVVIRWWGGAFQVARLARLRLSMSCGVGEMAARSHTTTGSARTAPSPLTLATSQSRIFSLSPSHSVRESTSSFRAVPPRANLGAISTSPRRLPTSILAQPRTLSSSGQRSFRIATINLDSISYLLCCANSDSDRSYFGPLQRRPSWARRSRLFYAGTARHCVCLFPPY